MAQHGRASLSGKRGADDPFTFVDASAFTVHAGEVILSGALLSGDTDGDAVANFQVAVVGTFAKTDLLL